MTLYAPRPTGDNKQSANNTDLEFLIQSLQSRIAKLEAEVAALKAAANKQ